MFISSEPAEAIGRARGRIFVDMAEKAMNKGQRDAAEYFIDLAYEALSVRYADAVLAVTVDVL